LLIQFVTKMWRNLTRGYVLLNSRGKCYDLALKNTVVPMFGLQAVFGPGTGETKKAAIMDFLKNSIGFGELAIGKDLVDEAEFVAGLDQAAEGVLRAVKATNLWQKAFGKIA
jgi:hypothetical protein